MSIILNLLQLGYGRAFLILAVLVLYAVAIIKTRKMTVGVIISAAAIIAIAAVFATSAGRGKDTPTETAADSEPEIPTDIDGDNMSDDFTEQITDLDEAANGQSDTSLTFGRILWNIYLSGTLPDGTHLEYDDVEAAEASSFTIADVDGDGKDELLLNWQDSVMAGMEEIIFGCDGDEVYVQLTEFPLLRIYDNGVIEADQSHNQGLAGRFWPYMVYVYNEELDSYEYVDSADAWDVEVSSEDNLGNPFPEDIDADGDGLVYYILSDNPDPYDGDILWMDGDEYESWHNSYIGNATELSLTWQQLTEENIAALGYPKPEDAS
ncbi:MAG: hypothetical protein LUC90_10370 [Lachnospiraceae bacterium]|nr:hypothetical protein [Lachnospiraceae bacterium]